jgi:hypothetical protein
MATTPDNLYQDVKTQLTDFKGFLDTGVPVIKPAFQALRSLVPQVDDLLSKLIDLMGQIKTAIQNLDVSKIPGVQQVTTFTQKITTLLQTVVNLVPSEADNINSVLGIAKVVGGLSDLGASLKTDISNLIDAIVTDLKSLQTA